MVCRKSTNTIKVSHTAIVIMIYIHVSVISVRKRISFKFTDQEWYSLATIMYHVFKFEITVPFQTDTALSWSSNEDTSYAGFCSWDDHIL